MAYRNKNYSAFYVDEDEQPFSDSKKNAHFVRDFRHYNMLKAWKNDNSGFPFLDAHEQNYNVRDGSDWERTLKPRIQERLNNSKNIIFFLSSITRNTRALRYEIEFGIKEKGLPLIVVYPDYTSREELIICDSGKLKSKVEDLWEKLPMFRDNKDDVPVLHVSLNKSDIKNALNKTGFEVQSKNRPGDYHFRCS